MAGENKEPKRIAQHLDSHRVAYFKALTNIPILGDLPDSEEFSIDQGPSPRDSE